MMENSLVRLAKDRWSLAVSPMRGGNLAFLRYGEKDILRPEQETDSFRWGSPVLLPANRTDGACFSFEGKEYRLEMTHPEMRMNLHGSISHCAFTVVERDSSSVRLQRDADERIYPFPFRLQLCYQLAEGKVKAEYRIENRSGRRMPYTFGLHTTFQKVKSFRLPLGKVMERDERKIPTGRLKELSEKEKAFCLRGINDGVISGYYTSCGHTAYVNDSVLFTVSENFDYWTLFSPQGCDYLCLEPQAGSVNGLNMGPEYFKTLEPGEIQQYAWTIGIQEQGEKE